MTNLPNVAKAGGIEGGQVSMFVSSDITGTGSSQNTAHGLGRVPTKVFGFIVQKDTTTAVDLIEGTHDATNCVFTCEATAEYRIVAF